MSSNSEKYRVCFRHPAMIDVKEGIEIHWIDCSSFQKQTNGLIAFYTEDEGLVAHIPDSNIAAIFVKNKEEEK